MSTKVVTIKGCRDPVASLGSLDSRVATYYEKRMTYFVDISLRLGCIQGMVFIRKAFIITYDILLTKNTYNFRFMLQTLYSG